LFLDPESRALFVVPRERVAPHRELDVKLYLEAYSPRILPSQVFRQKILQGM
jgi:hypothetical protein